MISQDCSVAVIGAGIVGIATAHALSVRHGLRDVLLIDPNPPMSLTSACSGENYRNWWPHPTMTAFTDDSIALMEDIAGQSGNRINMTRRGYALCTRASGESLIEELHWGYGESAASQIRVHDSGATGTYKPPLTEAWETAPLGVDVVRDQALIRQTFPSFADDIAMVIHIRRAGDISGQQLGQFMLEQFRDSGGRIVTGAVVGVEQDTAFTLDLKTSEGVQQLRAEMIVNAAGPFVGAIASLVDINLPVVNVLQQKIAFEDRDGCVPRDMPFAIDLDGQSIDWSNEEREALQDDPQTDWLTRPMPGAIHCRPDGGGRWIKLGWAYNQARTAPAWEPDLDPAFREIVLRGAARLNPALKAYYGRLPRNISHYGGFYTMTEENWPLIGPMGVEGAFVVGALSGFGTMAACAAGKLCAAWVAGSDLPDYAADLSLQRYENGPLMTDLSALQSKGVL
ncbi:MAG: FAD-dependent oxidoreductase [Rhodospirillaceae bacterium]|nr:FAD-dependent oxidoreductase [Rhodospirillaceae bacterium]